MNPCASISGPVLREAEATASALEAHVGYWLRFVSNHVSHSFQRRIEATGVTVAEWVVLREMLRLGPTSPTALGAALGMTKGAVSKLVARLERKALLSRAIVERDRRNHVIALTPEGRARVPALAAIADRNDEDFFGHMPEPARDALIATLRDVVRLHDLKAIPID